MMRKVILAVIVATLLTLASAPTAWAHPFIPPDSGLGDTPLNSEVARDNALDNYEGAVENSGGAAANSLFRNPTCGAHASPAGIHPPGNP